MQGVKTQQLDFDQIHDLYRHVRYLDVWKLTEDFWGDAALADELGADEIVLAVRLANVLGSGKISRALARLAHERYPEHPLVRIRCRERRRHKDSLFYELQEYDDHPILDSDDPSLEAGWCAQHAILRSLVRDFEEAHRWIERAREFVPDMTFIDACEARVFFNEDDWKYALECAQKAWASRPGAPYVSAILGSSLAALGRSGDAGDLFLGWVKGGGQSFPTLELGIHYSCVAIEQGEGGLGSAAAKEIYVESDRLAAMAPLADRTTTGRFANLRARTANLAGKRDALKRHAEESSSPYYLAVAANLQKNPHGERILLAHRKVKQAHNTCLPASVAICLSAFGFDVDHDELVHRMTYNGTADWRIVAWSEERNLIIRPFIGDCDSALALIQAGAPFVFSMNWIGGAHACAAVGVDLGTGTLLYRDPASNQIEELLLNRFGQGEAPIGPQCLLLAPKSELPRFDGITLGQERFARAKLEFDNSLETKGLTHAGEAVAGLLETEPDRPATRFLKALLLERKNELAEAVVLLRGLLKEFPGAIAIQESLLSATQRLGDTTNYRETLGAIVDRSPLPGLGDSQDWIYPDAVLVARYADMLSQAAKRASKALRLLEKALSRNPYLGESYHYLGDLLWKGQTFDRALLPYRVASLLAYEHEHYADAYAWALRKCGRSKEGIEWLEKRVEKLTGMAGGGAAWITLVETLEAFGYPEKSLDTLRKGCSERPWDSDLAFFAAVYFGKHGLFQEAEEALSRGQKTGRPAQFHQASAQLERSRGRLDRALDHARSWMKEVPTDENARRHLMALVRATQGEVAARQLVDDWIADQPENEKNQELLLEIIDGGTEPELRLDLLRARVKANPFDAWAWCELAWDLVTATSKIPPPNRSEALAELHEVIAECVATSPEHPSTIALQGEAEHFDGNREGAVDFYRRALIRDPDYSYAITRLFRLTAPLPLSEKRRVIGIIGEAFSNTARDLFSARAAAVEIAANVGLDEANSALRRWTRLSPQDPSVTEAWADVNIQYGSGRPDVEKVLPRLKRMVGRFPRHRGLRHSLANAHWHLQGFENAAEQYYEILRYDPRATRVRLHLASVLDRLGRNEEALKQSSLAVKYDPLDRSTWFHLCDVFLAAGRQEEAVETLSEATEKIPSEFNIWERLIETLQSLGRGTEAVERAEALCRLYPGESEPYRILASALQNPQVHQSSKKIKEAFEISIEKDRSNWNVVWGYACFLCELLEFDRATQILREHQPLAEDDTFVRGGIAAVDRWAGRNSDALEKMAALLREQPDYWYGWRCFMEWVSADEAWDLAREILPLMAPTLEEDETLECDRLELLEKAGEEVTEIDGSWDRLLDDRPNSLEVYCRRCDDLFEKKLYEDSDNLLDRIAVHNSDLPHVLARRVRQACLADDSQAVADNTAAFWRIKEEIPAGSACIVFEALDSGSFLKTTFGEVIAYFRRGACIEVSAFRNLMNRCQKPEWCDNIVQLLEVLDGEEIDWYTSDHMALALDALCEANEADRVLEWGRAHADRCRKDTQLWQMIGRALFVADDKVGAKKWFSSWRRHEGVEQWALANYADVCNLQGDYEVSIEASLFALEELEYDHSTHILVNILLKAVLKMEDFVLFQDLVRRYLPIMEHKGDLQKMHRLFDLFSKMMAEDDRRGLRSLNAAYLEVRPRRTWLDALWRRLMLAKLNFGQKLLFLVGAWR